jgi:hypothetical protein
VERDKAMVSFTAAELSCANDVHSAWGMKTEILLTAKEKVAMSDARRD